MITHTFIDKCNTIHHASHENYGRNPVAELNYGNDISRFLLHFDISKLKALVSDGTYPIRESLRHVIKMTNCGSVGKSTFDDMMVGVDATSKKRAVSFKVIALKVPIEWHDGVGFDGSNEYWVTGEASVSYSASNWFNATTSTEWEHKGVYTTKFIEDEYEKFMNNEDSAVVGEQTFEYGNENLSIDITGYVNKLIDGDEVNNGVCIMFAPENEEINITPTQYVGFFTNHTNTCFKPYLETRYNEEICDDRTRFYLNKENRLYLYCNIGGELCSLDELPVCTIDGIQYPVVHQSKGVYYASVKLDKSKYEPDTILTDIWSNIKLHGDYIEDVELDFVAKSDKMYFNIGDTVHKPHSLSVSLSGINDNEKIFRTDRRMVKVKFTVPYTKDYSDEVSCARYRIMVKDGNRYVEVIPWDSIALIAGMNHFFINTDELSPERYYVDIEVGFNNEKRLFKNELEFTVISDTTELKK